MPPTNSKTKSTLLADLPPYIYGTTRLGDDQIPFDDRVRMALVAMDAGIWFHTSHTYGNALEVLRAAFDQAHAKVPKLIIKIGWSSIAELRDVIRQNLEPLGVDSIELGQLCLGGELANDFARGGNCYKEFSRLKQEGLVRRFVFEVFPWTSDAPLKALRGGYPEGIVDGYIFLPESAATICLQRALGFVEETKRTHYCTAHHWRWQCASAAGCSGGRLERVFAETGGGSGPDL
jgi:hypothetical protein